MSDKVAMSEKFDPYHKWLGIPPADQPPHHYRLLGIGRFESDPDVIEGAADRQMAHVQTYKTGPHSAVSQKILNELAAAKICLLNAKKRAAYDEQLKARLPAAATPAAAGASPPRAVAIVPTAEPAGPAPMFDAPASAVDSLVVSNRTAAYGRARARKRAQVQLAMGLLGVALVTVLAIIFWRPWEKTPETAGTQGEHPATPAVAPQDPVPEGASTPGNVAPTNPAVGDHPQPPSDTSATPDKSGTKPAPAGSKPPRQASEGNPTRTVASAPSTETPEGTPKPVDLLGLLARQKEVTYGDMQDHRGQPLRLAMMRIPFDIPDEYDLLLEANRNRQDDALLIGLVAGPSKCLVRLDGSQGGHSGLSLINGQPAHKNPTDREGPVFTQQGRTTVLCAVRRDRITVTVDGRQVIFWKGDFRNLSVDPEWNIPTRHLHLGAHKAGFQFTKVELTPIKTTEQMASASPPPSQPDQPDENSAGDPSSTVSGPKKKKPVPGDEELATARQEVEKAYGEELSAAKTAAARLALAEKLLGQGTDPANELTSRYALLDRARELAAAGGDAELALRSVDELAKQFQVDSLQLKIDSAAQVSKMNRPAADRQTFAESLLKLVEEAIDAERFDEAGRLADIAKSEAAKAGDMDLKERADRQDKLVARLAKAQESVHAAETALEADPADAEAHLALGKHYCFVREDWETGLEHLLLGSDLDLKSLAEQEKSEPDDPDDQAKLGDGWWQQAGRTSGADKTALQGRARFWYEQALPGLAPLKKKAIEERLGTETGTVAQAPKKPSSLLMQKVKKAIKDNRLVQTPTIGETSGDSFLEVPEDGGLLVGLKLTLRKFRNAQYLTSIQPIFMTPEGDVEDGKVYGRLTGTTYEVRAREGYAVGGIAVKGRTRVEGLGVVFVKLGGSTLNKRDTYNGEWQGATGTSQSLGVLGKPVVGIHGSLGENGGELEALGLIHLP